MAEATQTQTQTQADPKASKGQVEPKAAPTAPTAEERKAQRKALRAELKALQAKRTCKVYDKPGESARLVSHLSPDEIAHFKKTGREVPQGLTKAEEYRLWELGYLAAGQPVPVREDLDD